MIEFFYPTHEASNDNFEAQIYVADIKFILLKKKKKKKGKRKKKNLFA